MSDNDLRIELLERQVRALRSVLSEIDCDKECYIQWRCAEVIEEMLNHLKYSWAKHKGDNKERN